MSADIRKIFLPDTYITTNKFKDQLRNCYYYIKIFDIDNSDTDNSEDAVINYFNFPEKADETYPLTMFTKKVSGLKDFKLGSAKDTLPGGWTNVIPANPTDTSGVLKIDLRILENLVSLKYLTNRLWLLYLSQNSIGSSEGDSTDDNNIIKYSGSDINFDTRNEQEITTKIINKLNTVFSSSNSNLENNKKIFFKTVVSLLSYTTKKPIMNYILYNCWVSGFTPPTDASVSEGSNLPSLSLEIQYDLQRISGTNYSAS